MDRVPSAPGAVLAMDGGELADGVLGEQPGKRLDVARVEVLDVARLQRLDRLDV
jgi:hypothetical protein